MDGYKATHALLFFAIIDSINRNKWAPTSLPYEYLVNKCRFGKRVYLESREWLIHNHLIKMIPGKNAFQMARFSLGVAVLNSTTNSTTTNEIAVPNDTSTSTTNSTTTTPLTAPINKHKTNKHKTINISKSHSGKKPVNESENILYWKIIVDTWFTFYKSRFSLNPTFDGQSTKALKKIIIGLEGVSKQKSVEWTEETAVKYFSNFLTKAYQDEWLNKKFLLNILASNFDAIVNPNNNGTNFKSNQKHRPSVEPATVDITENWGRR